MKKLNVISVLLLTYFLSSAQETAPLIKISRETAKDLSLPLVNQFQVAMTKLPQCPCLILNGTNNLFAKNAKIEVSSLNGKPQSYTPEAYFRAVNALHCGKKPVYSSMKFVYRPLPRSSAIVSYAPGSISVAYPINQLFVGVQTGTGRVYMDITIKIVNIGFIADEHGVLQPKITGITVDETQRVTDHVTEKNS